EQGDDGGKADQAFKHGGSPKPGRLSLTIAAARRPVPPGKRAAGSATAKIEHVSQPNASSLQPLSNAEVSRRPGIVLLSEVAWHVLQVVMLVSAGFDEDDQCRNAARAC
ncbi:hypothetical protein, partial [Mesorhizobium sp. M4B.F.Ca.ET.013.02.1.1]|uniref:hypothetical protein n=1 Tax=Mesorhizobium sp. M4B.F.Ca.ET.013.02.1.1 TaxID=2496755 RepID=UPI001AECCDE6